MINYSLVPINLFISSLIELATSNFFLLKLELYLFENGIDSRPMFYDINQHKYLSHIVCENMNAKILQSQCLILPSYPELTNGQMMFICDKIKKFLGTYE
jgi:perosamine synthetase